MLQCLLGMLGAIVIHCLYAKSNSQIATVDITEIVKSFESDVLKQKIPDDVLTQKITTFGKSLNTALLTYADKKHIILVPKEVVIAGSIDRTDDIKSIINKRMKS